MLKIDQTELKKKNQTLFIAQKPLFTDKRRI